MPETNLKQKKKIFPIIVAVVIAIIAICFAIIGYMIYLKPIEVDLTKVMTTPKFVGVEGDGTLEAVTVDKKKVNELVSSVKGDKRAASVAILLNDVIYEVDQGEYLSTGDSVTITAVYDKTFAKNNRINVTADTKEVTAKGFDDKPIDLSAKEIENSGVLEHLEVSLRSSEDFGYFEQNLYCKSSSGNMIAAIVSEGGSYRIYNTSKFTYKLDDVEWKTLDVFKNKTYDSMDDAYNAIKAQGYTYEVLAIII